MVDLIIRELNKDQVYFGDVFQIVLLRYMGVLCSESGSTLHMESLPGSKKNIKSNSQIKLEFSG